MPSGIPPCALSVATGLGAREVPLSSLRDVLAEEERL